MIKRLFVIGVVLWLAGFAWFSWTLPKAVDGPHTDAAVVLTGGPGRVRRGLEILLAHKTDRLLISGVDLKVEASDIAATYHVPEVILSCCVRLGRQAGDTRSNALEIGNWVRKNHYHSVRVITNNWHMRRAQFELGRALPKNIVIIDDAVEVAPSLMTLVVEYQKYIWRRAAAWLEDVRR